VYAHKKFTPEEEKNISVYNCSYMVAPKQKYWTDKDLCAPKQFFINESDYTC
jgi:hypothetical protein